MNRKSTSFGSEHRRVVHMVMLSWIACCLTVFGTAEGLAAISNQSIDNSALLPKILPDDQVKMEGLSPDWVKTLIMAQFRIETATPEGTFQSAVKVLDHYAEMGVNGLWINPIWERGSKGNGYGNMGCNTIEPLLTGCANIGDSYKVVKQFVDEAHRRNIRLFFDVVVWGTRSDSSLVTQHPEFYLRNADKTFWKVWGGYGFDWNSKALQQWYRKAAVKFIEETGADGFRVDLAPDTSGYFFQEIREALYAKGRKIMIMSECDNERKRTFDLEQVGVSGWTEVPDYSDKEKLQEQKRRFGSHSDYLLRNNIVDVIETGKGVGIPSLQQQGKGGAFRFYTFNILSHDDPQPFVQGNRIRFAYQSIFAPFIPVFWIGEEWNNPKKNLADDDGSGVMYFNTIDWSQLENPVNREFFEDIKKYIHIRRSYPEIFEYFPDTLRRTNIVKVDSSVDGVANSLQAYARFRDNKTVIVVPNYQQPHAAKFRIDIPRDALRFSWGANYRITDLMTGALVAEGNAENLKSFSAAIEPDRLGIYLIEGK